MASRVDADEYFAYQYFLYDVMPILLAARDRDFWRGFLQLGNSEPVISDALLAIGCFYKQHQRSDKHILDSICDSSPRSLLAIKFYDRSVSTLREKIQEGSCEPRIVMLGFMLFTCIEVSCLEQLFIIDVSKLNPAI